MISIVRKELADFVTSARGMILIPLLIIATCAVALHAARYGISAAAAQTGYIFLKLFTTSETGMGTTISQLMNFHTIIGLFFLPIVGISLGFNAVNSERSSGTMSRILSQPIYRDQVINAKMITGLLIMATMMGVTLLLISGVGLRIIGIPPSSMEISRLAIYFVFSVVYGAFWLGLSVLSSVLFRRPSTSLLAVLSFWLFFSIFYIFLIAPALANAIAPTDLGTTAVITRNADIQSSLLRISPSYLFLEASSVLLLPLVRTLGVINTGQMAYMAVNPLSLPQSMLLAAPHFVALVALAAITIGASYVLFMKQEIRVT
jgi:ABC-2 type transport system permease protein